jgi:hypothetical protein
MNPSPRWRWCWASGARWRARHADRGAELLQLPARRSGCCAATRCGAVPVRLREALLFLVVLLPFAAALSAVLMAVAIRCRSFKEAQANSTRRDPRRLAAAAGDVFNQAASAVAPVGAGAGAADADDAGAARRGFGVEQVVVPGLVCGLLTAAGLAFVARMLKTPPRVTRRSARGLRQRDA